MEHNTQNHNFSLPNIKDIRIQLITYKPPKHRYFESSFSKYKEAIEFKVLTDRPIPVRALSPVLHIGNTSITEGESLSPNEYRFLAFKINELEDNTPIYFAWQGDPDYINNMMEKIIKKYSINKNNNKNKTIKLKEY